MREKPRDEGRLRHIAKSIDNIQFFLHDKTAEDFLLTQDFKDSHRGTPWRDIINMRHILVHGYYHVDSREVWATIVNDLPLLKAQIESYINEFQSSE